MNIVKNSLVGERCGCELSVVHNILMKIMERSVLKWFGNEERLVMKIYLATVESKRKRKVDRREDGGIK